MKDKRYVIIGAIATAIAVLLSGCIDVNLLDDSGDLLYNWQRVDGEEEIRFDEDKTGIVLVDRGEDYTISWDFSPNLDSTMVWTILEFEETRVYEYYVLGEDKDILVLVDQATGLPWAYYKS